MPFLSKYNVARHIYINIPKAGSANHAVGADWTPAAGDVKISKDGGAAANVTNLPTAIAMGNSAIWDFSITATEMQAAQVVITVSDSATKAVDDTGFIIETYGNNSSQHEFDLDNPSAAQSGDCYARLGAPAGASVSADVAAIQSDTDNIQTRLPAALVSGRMDSSVGAMASNVITAAATAADFTTEVTAGLSTLDAAGVRSAIGLASANLDTQLTAIDDYIDTEVAAIKAKTDNLPADPADASDIAAAFSTVNSTLATVASYIDTEVAAIKTKTDFLPSATAGAAGGLFIAGSNAATTVNFTGNLSGSVGSVTGAVGSVTGDIGGNVVGSVGSVTAGVTVTTNNDKAGYRLSSTGVDDILDEDVEGSHTFREYLRGIASALFAKLSGAETTSVVVRDVDDSKDRITATVDADGNRSSVTIDLS